MGLFDGILKIFKSDSAIVPEEPGIEIKPKTQEPNEKEITSEDLHISDGLTRKLNTEKLEWCLCHGIDNKPVRAAVKEKERNDIIRNSDMEFKSERKILYQNLCLELSKYNLSRKDDPATKKSKKAQKEILREEYRKKTDELATKRDTKFASAVGEKFFYDLMEDEDATGWEWTLCDPDTHCKICKKNEGRYKKGTGPKYPAHDGCTCFLDPVYDDDF